TAASSAAIDQSPVEQAPYYPAACLARHGDLASDYSASVIFDVTRYGYVKNVRLVESDDACVDESAKAFARSLRVDARYYTLSAETDDQFLSIKFTRPQVPQIRPLLIVAPEYPHGCRTAVGNIRKYLVQFNVDEGGAPEDIVFVASPARCAERAIARAVRKWRFAQTPADGTQQLHQFWFLHETLLYNIEEWTRASAAAVFDEIEDLIENRKDYPVALEKLADFEASESAKLRRDEVSRFYNLRAAARLGLGQRAAALDDFHAARQSMLWILKYQEPAAELLELEKEFGVIDITVRMRNATRVSPLDSVEPPLRTN
ncbi:MAG TPA: hypothetical protein PKM48_11840, partial [Parvularculaceae bacterium]|nr:hypothetical protein [Parvularculaceae bacterium]